MKAMVLAAGVGERMRPLTLHWPKPALPVLGRPLLLHILRRLRRCGVRVAVINLHHLPERIEQVVHDATPETLPRVRFSFEREILGTAGALRHAAPLLRGAGPILITNSDFLIDADPQALLAAHQRSGHAATLVLSRWRPGYSAVEVDAGGNVLSIAGTPKADPERVAGKYLFTGLHLIDESVLDRIPPGRSEIVGEVYRPLAAEGRLGAFIHDGYWWEFGSPRLFLEGSLGLLDLTSAAREAITDECDPIRKLDGAVAAMGAAATVRPEVRCRGRIALGLASEVGSGAELEDSVIFPEAWIGPGCRVRRSVIAGGVELPAGFEADSVLVCPDADPPSPLPPATRRTDRLLVQSLAAVPA